MAKNKCKYCNNNCEGDFCMHHKPRKSLNSGRGIKPSTIKFSYDIEEAKKTRRNTFFNTIWNKRLHLSEISGLPLVGEPLTIYFHHILEKEMYKEAEFDEDNIILLTWEEHDNVGNDKHRYEEINQRRETLLQKYSRTRD